MDDNFFHDEPKQEDEEFQGYSEMPEGQPQADSTTEPKVTSIVGSAAFNNPQFNYDEPFQAVEQSSPEVDETLERIRKDEDALMTRLRLKAVSVQLTQEQEAQLKRKRREKGARELEEFQSQKSKQVEANRVIYRQNANNLKTQNQNYRSPWEKVADNIALKEGDYPGTKNVSRMRDVILSKKQDDLQKK